MASSCVDAGRATRRARVGLALVAVGLMCPVWAATGQTPAWTRRPPLQFLGFQAGVRLSDVITNLEELEGTELRCQRATRDPGVLDCRAVVGDPTLGGQFELWVSATDSLVAVLSVAGPVEILHLEAWRSSLQAAYGAATATVQGTQSMLQWVRHRQMLRLTWRKADGGLTASVSLVDGPTLDGWDRRVRHDVPHTSPP